MGKIYDFNNLKPNNKLKNNFDFKIIPAAIACYCFGNLGAFVVLLFSRSSSNKLITFHAAQSMIFYLLIYFAQIVLQSVGILFLPIYQLFRFIKILFVVFGMFKMITGKRLYIPYLSDIASRWVW